jgi:hypothetical protein
MQNVVILRVQNVVILREERIDYKNDLFLATLAPRIAKTDVDIKTTVWNDNWQWLCIFLGPAKNNSKSIFQLPIINCGLWLNHWIWKRGLAWASQRKLHFGQTSEWNWTSFQNATDLCMYLGRRPYASFLSHFSRSSKFGSNVDESFNSSSNGFHAKGGWHQLAAERAILYCPEKSNLNSCLCT